MSGLLGIETDWTRFPQVALFSPGGSGVGASRVLDFYDSAQSLGMARFGIKLLACPPLLSWQRPRDADVLWSPTAVGIVAILPPLFLALLEPFTHHEAYGALLLLFLAGAITLSSFAYREMRKSRDGQPDTFFSFGCFNRLRLGCVWKKLFAHRFFWWLQ